MKTFAYAALTALMISQPALAGSYSEPKIEAPTIVAETTSSSAGGALPLFLAFLTLIAAVNN
ncbi:hypothetical protein [Pseudooceanicola sp.]|uniref:hypothetical protein n=1 Tax=Pseudooceanicola sp. TaxID=1914328 RepID=UPI0035C6CDF8